MPIPSSPPGPDVYAPPAAIVATVPVEVTPPPLPAPTRPPSVPRPAPARSMLTGKARHVVTGASALTMLGVGTSAWAVDPASLDASSPLMVAPVLTLAAQAVMALIGYLRDYGAERLEMERARTAEALEGRRVAQAEAAALREELHRREEREAAEREARYLAAMEELEELRKTR
jgi:hypothetical protein